MAMPRPSPIDDRQGRQSETGANKVMYLGGWDSLLSDMGTPQLWQVNPSRWLSTYMLERTAN